MSYQGRILQFRETNTVAKYGNKAYILKCEKSTFDTFCEILKTTTCSLWKRWRIAQPIIIRASTKMKARLLFINNVMAEIKSHHGNTRTVSDTYLLTLDQSVKINGTEYRHRNKALPRTPLTSTAQKTNLKEAKRAFAQRGKNEGRQNLLIHIVQPFVRYF